MCYRIAQYRFVMRIKHLNRVLYISSVQIVYAHNKSPSCVIYHLSTDLLCAWTISILCYISAQYWFVMRITNIHVVSYISSGQICYAHDTCPDCAMYQLSTDLLCAWTISIVYFISAQYTLFMRIENIHLVFYISSVQIFYAHKQSPSCVIYQLSTDVLCA